MSKKHNHIFPNKTYIDWQEGQIFVIVRCKICNFGKFIYKYREQTIYVNHLGKRVPHAEDCKTEMKELNEMGILAVEKKLDLASPLFKAIPSITRHQKGRVMEDLIANKQETPKELEDIQFTEVPPGKPYEFKKHQEDMNYELEEKPNKEKPRFSFRDLKARPAPDNPKIPENPTTDTKPYVSQEILGKVEIDEPNDLKGVLPSKQEIYEDSLGRIWDLARQEIKKNPSKYTIGVDPAKPGNDMSAISIVTKENDAYRYTHYKQPMNLVARLEEAVVLVRIMYEEMIMLDSARTKGMKMAQRFLQSSEYRELIKELETQRKLQNK